MSKSLGRLCLVLHGHLPYVLHHGVWPHGEAWLYEAAAETYLPLLELLNEFAATGLAVGITIGLTPVLLEQLAHKQFKQGFQAYLSARIERAQHDAVEFENRAEPRLAELARIWEDWHLRKLEHFRAIKCNIPGAFATHFQQGRIEILTSAASHAYLPLLLNDESVSAQVSIGAETSLKHLGKKSTGFWMPECAYRPAYAAWQPAVLHPGSRARPGLETFIAAAGLSHFFVDTHLVTEAQPLAILQQGGWDITNDALTFWDNRRGWGNPLDAVGVAPDAQMPIATAFARHPRVSQQVWSGAIGYPGAGEYLEFHRKHGDHGLRYHRVTNHHTAVEHKKLYDPDLIAGRVYEQAVHFCGILRETLSEYTALTGRVGTIVAPFDAELFGHWWFEGPRFLRDVILTLASDKTIDLLTAEQAEQVAPPDKVVRLPEGSWGEGGHHHVWLNDQTRWLWTSEYRVEDEFQSLLRDLPWRSNPSVQKMLQLAGRELLLMQSSDWPFVIHSDAAADYGVARFAGHMSRFHRLGNLARKTARGEVLKPVEKSELLEAKLHDVIFEDIALNHWLPKSECIIAQPEPHAAAW